MANAFRKTFTENDFDTETTVSLPAGKYVPLYEYRVPAKQIVYWGNGAIQGGVENRGLFKMAVNDGAGTPVGISGNARIVVQDANRRRTEVVQEFYSDQFSDTSAITFALGEGIRLGLGGDTGLTSNPAGASEDAYLVIQYAADAADTATTANCELRAPVTVETL